MTQKEYNNTDWQRGNVVRLTNGKEYPVKKPKKKYLLLYSAEHESYFVANCAFSTVVPRTMWSLIPRRRPLR